ncbi:carboxymuconolactone decarboxylase family protein [Neptunomonas japonica]|uniref:Alkylhydroperoxidase n=1 Tax=Neptunomonas japonica JAMM 1380 TaxID=1441457 RepID=A0A7R6PC15_9GAMM|nr:carboxymuconolactone decarboxylase family protein [Neptunomonas japonica]BBB29724.1 alkylhydroperoxidase [Neptunomonas japonica JAMM 1380]
MDNKTKELIAIGSSMATNCMPCLEFHIGKAKSHGASMKELIIASKIGIHVKAGAAEKMESYASKIIQGFSEEEVEDICNCD